MLSWIFKVLASEKFMKIKIEMTLQALKKIMVLIEINTCNCIGGVMVSGLLFFLYAACLAGIHQISIHSAWLDPIRA
jgi:hypothetical protein